MDGSLELNIPTGKWEILEVSLNPRNALATITLAIYASEESFIKGDYINTINLNVDMTTNQDLLNAIYQASAASVVDFLQSSQNIFEKIVEPSVPPPPPPNEEV